MFQKCRYSIILPTVLPLDTPGGAQIAYPDSTAISNWYSSNAQLSILGMVPRIQLPIFR